MENKFDQLLNEKCSWSYRSQKVVRSKKVNTNGDNLPMEVKQTVMRIDISQNKYDEVPRHTESEYSFDVNKQDTCSKSSRKKAAKNARKRSVPFQKACKTFRSSTTLKEKSPVSNSSRVLSKRNAKPQNIETQTSSSDEEVLQTRNPIDQNNFNHIDDYSESSGITVFKETVCDKEKLDMSFDEKKSSPIIIKAVPCNSNESNSKNLDTQNVSTNNKEETFEPEVTCGLDFGSTDSLCVEINSPNLNEEYNFNKATKYMKIGQTDINNKNSSNTQASSKCLENSSQVNEYSNSNNSFLSQFKTNLEDKQVVLGFLNGSLDGSAYASPNKCSDDILKIKEQEENLKSSSTEPNEELSIDMDCNNAFEQGEKLNFFQRNKIMKQKNDMLKRKESYHSPTIEYLTLLSSPKRKRPHSQAENVRKKTKVGSFNDYDTVNQKYLNIEKTKSKRNYMPQIKNSTIECINLSSTEDEKKNKANNSGNRPRRYARLAASERIKEIEKFENSAPSDDSDICLVHEDNFSTTLSQNIRKNLNEITKKHLKNISFKRKERDFSDTSDYNTNMKAKKNYKKKGSSHARKKKAEDTSCKNVFNDLFLKQKSQNSETKNSEENFCLSDTNSNKDSYFKTVFQKNINKANKLEVIPTNYDKNKHCLLKNNNIRMTQQTTETERKTWETLELELLNEVDKEIVSKTKRLEGNVSKTIIFTQERLVRKSKDAKDNDFISVLNTSMTQRFSENTKNDITEHNRIIALKEKVPAHFVNKGILEKTISAMEVCSTNVLLPQIVNCSDVSSSKADQDEESDPIFMFDKDLEFNPDIDEGKQYLITKQIMDFTSVTNRKNDSRNNGNIHKNQNDFTFLRQHQNEKQIIKHFNDHAPISSGNYSKDTQIKALETFRNSMSNPWDDLLKKLSMENDHDQCLSNKYEYPNKLCEQNGKLEKQSTYNNSVCNTDDIIAENIIDENTANNSKLLEVEEEECISPVNNNLGEYTLQNKNDISSLIFVDDSKNNSELTEKISVMQSKEKFNNKNIATGSKDKMKKNKIPKKSSTFKMKAKEDGSMQLSLDSSSNSTKMDYDFPAGLKNNEVCLKSTERNNKNKYKNYLKNLFNKVDNLDQKGDEHCGQNKDSTQSKTPNSRVLIAENEDDIFSLSSTDSDSSKEVISCGTGLLCDLFDE